MSSPVLELRGISRTFRRRFRPPVHAVRNLTLSVHHGEVFALLGPNGSGKTTTFRMITLLLPPDQGTILWKGKDIRHLGDPYRKCFGYLAADIGVYPRLTVREILTLFGTLNGVQGKTLQKRVEALLERFDLRQVADERIRALSTGYRQRTAIARTLVHDPELLILDEPTRGLDVATTHTVYEVIQEARALGKTVLLSTHLMEEAEMLSDRVGLLYQGRLRALGTVEELRARSGKTRLREVYLSLLKDDVDVEASSSPP